MPKPCGCDGDELCIRHKIRTINLSASALPSRRKQAQKDSAADKRLDADRAAYKRLRHDGLQPPRVDGSAELECKGTIPEHIESGHTEWDPVDVKRAEEFLGRKVTQPRTEESPW